MYLSTGFRWVCCAALAFAGAGIRGTQPGRQMATLPCVADTNLSSYEGEADQNYGASTRFRLKGIQMMALLRFDASRIRGWRVAGATLRMRYAGGDRKLRTLGFSSVATDWEEGTGSGSAPAQGCTFNRAAPPTGRWAGTGMDFTDASFGMAGTVEGYSDVRETGDGWLEAPVPVPVVDAALANGRGIAVTDEKGQTAANNDIYSREQSASQPVLIIEGQPAGLEWKAPAPPRPAAAAPSLPPALPVQAGPRPAGDWVGGGTGLRVAALPETEKAHPVTGAVLERCGAQRYGVPGIGPEVGGDGIWYSGAVHLRAARGEVVAFQLLLDAQRGPVSGVSVQVAPDLKPERGGPLHALRSWVSRLWSVKGNKWAPEYCVPLTGAFDIPWRANKVHGQRFQSVFVELLAPANAPPGLYRAEVEVRHGADTARLPVLMELNSLRMPDAPRFDVSLNTYGPVSRAWRLPDESPRALALEREFHRMAHLHRATLASLGYSHGGDVTAGYAPPVAGTGADLRVTDWSAWDARWGPYLDGRAFDGLPRGRTPVTHLYLPIHEAWPADIRADYAFKASTRDYPACIIEHALKAPAIADALPASYGDAVAAASRLFADHARQRGWNRTEFQFYLNNKNMYRDPAMGGRGVSWWLLDEPNYRDDWLALAYFARQMRRGAPRGSVVRFREDCSRPQWQRNRLDGLVDLMVVNEEIYHRPALIETLRTRAGTRFWTYGEANSPETPDIAAEGWCVRAWLAGADGVAPWQTVGGEEALTTPDPTALLVPGRAFGIDGPVASIRLKALRRGQQDAEYLAALASARGWSRRQTAAALAGALRACGVSLEGFTPGRHAGAAFADLRSAAARAVGTGRR
ncbi:MAG: DUF4091 domain-containing protein [Armatimonadetes bacterium]|nr:DUF4091 domain-containing protein [Armatimonadota bacterium]